MPFPSTADPLARALLAAQDASRNLKRQAQDLKAASLAGPVSGNAIVEFYTRLVAAKATFDAVAATPGIAAYARDQFDDPALDIVAEFSAMSTQVTACGTWVTNNFPKDGAGYLLKDKLTAAGVDVRTFSTASLAAFRTELDSLVATIN
jgi:hypothetical protein